MFGSDGTTGAAASSVPVNTHHSDSVMEKSSEGEVSENTCRSTSPDERDNLQSLTERSAQYRSAEPLHMTQPGGVEAPQEARKQEEVGSLTKLLTSLEVPESGSQQSVHSSLESQAGSGSVKEFSDSEGAEATYTADAEWTEMLDELMATFEEYGLEETLSDYTARKLRQTIHDYATSSVIDDLPWLYHDLDDVRSWREVNAERLEKLGFTFDNVNLSVLGMSGVLLPIDFDTFQNSILSNPVMKDLEGTTEMVETYLKKSNVDLKLSNFYLEGNIGSSAGTDGNEPALCFDFENQKGFVLPVFTFPLRGGAENAPLDFAAELGKYFQAKFEEISEDGGSVPEQTIAEFFQQQAQGSEPS